MSEILSWSRRVAEFAALDELAGVAGMSSRVTHRLSMGDGTGKAAELHARGTAFLRDDLVRLRDQGRQPQHPILRELAGRITPGGDVASLELPPGEELRLLQTAWEGACTGLPVESRFLPIRDRYDQPFDGVVARLVRFKPPEEIPHVMGLFVSPGIIETPAKFIDRWKALAERGFDVFVFEMPGVHTSLFDPIPLEGRFVSSHVASHTLAAAAQEAALWMTTDPKSRGLLMGGLLASHSTVMGIEAAVVLGHTLPFGAGLAIEGARVRAGKKYNAARYLVTRVLARLNKMVPSVFGRFNFPVSRPKARSFMPEGDPRLAWQRQHHDVGLSPRTYNGLLTFSVWPAQRALEKALFAANGHRALPSRLRIGTYPGDEEVANAVTERLMAQIDADASRPRVTRVEQPAHSMGYFPETDQALVEWFLAGKSM